LTVLQISLIDYHDFKYKIIPNYLVNEKRKLDGVVKYLTI